MMKKGLLWAELISLFVLIPLIYYLDVVSIPKIPLLLVFFVGCLIVLFKSPEYNRRELLHALDDHLVDLKWVLYRSLAVAVLSVGAVLVIDPNLLFGFPRARPGLWLMVMLLYPLLSAYPQEVIYRAFFFHRYKQILPSQGAVIWTSTVTFAFLHIIFDNWLAVILTVPAGYIFSRTYVKTGSLLVASIEHGIYGCIVFTTGLGRFFYNPS